MIERFDLQTTNRNQLIDISATVEQCVIRSGIMAGVCVVYTPHTTAAITINENADPSVKSDILAKLATVFPQQDGYRHLEGNSDAHLKSSIFGCSETLIVEAGTLILGTWQGIFFCEFDGPRQREFFVKITGA
jgi:secondary thiamine-phosphate synthase enzyme